MLGSIVRSVTISSVINVEWHDDGAAIALQDLFLSQGVLLQLYQVMFGYIQSGGGFKGAQKALRCHL